MEQKDVERFWSKVDIKGNEECWDWTAGKSSSGYGKIRIKNKDYRANRVSLFLKTGIWDVCAMHTCDRPCCVNPKHLKWGSYKENIDDKFQKKRHNQSGEKHPSSKLTETQVLEIREKYLNKYYGIGRGLAAEYGVTPSLISYIISEKSWSHI